MKSRLAAGIACICLTACVASPKSQIEERFVAFGLSAERAGCLATELDDRLENNDLQAVADFVDGLSAADSPGATLDTLLSIDNPRAASAVARAGLSCAF